MLHDPVCPQCGRPLPGDSPRGLCPACLLRAVLRDDRTVRGRPGARAAPEPPERARRRDDPGSAGSEPGEAIRE
jgi:hypothetical protein